MSQTEDWKRLTCVILETAMSDLQFEGRWKRKRGKEVECVLESQVLISGRQHWKLHGSTFFRCRRLAPLFLVLVECPIQSAAASSEI